MVRRLIQNSSSGGSGGGVTQFKNVIRRVPSAEFHVLYTIVKIIISSSQMSVGVGNILHTFVITVFFLNH